MPSLSQKTFGDLQGQLAGVSCMLFVGAMSIHAKHSAISAKAMGSQKGHLVCQTLHLRGS